MKSVLFCFLMFLFFFGQAQNMYQLPEDGETRWVSFENPTGEKGRGGWKNKGAKGSAWGNIEPGESKVLMNVKGAGEIRRIWLTLADRSPEMLRSLRVDMYWDGESKPAVSAPLGDFFGLGIGRQTAYQNALFSDPEGRSFNCNIQMPFSKGARITITNEANRKETFFYEINFLKLKKFPTGALYFHAHWNKNTNSKLGEDFEILPKVIGKGRFLGSNLGIITDSSYKDSWWGEGETKIYLDGDKDLATLVSTGTEDYIGSAWSQGAYANLYQGCLIDDPANRQWAFYRYHIPDPVYFRNDIRVTIQQMGGHGLESVRALYKNGARLIPVSVTAPDYSQQWDLLTMENVPELNDPDFPKTWVNFYRLDNFSATAYFYLDKPVSNLPPLASLQERLEGILK